MPEFLEQDEAGMLVKCLIYDLGDTDTAVKIGSILNCNKLDSAGTILIDLFDSIERGTLREFYHSVEFELDSAAERLLAYYESMKLLSQQADSSTVINKLRECNNASVSEEVMPILLQHRPVLSQPFHLEVFRKVHDLNYSTIQASQILDTALQFKDLLYEGRYVRHCKADIASFIFLRAFLFIYENSQQHSSKKLSAVNCLRSICENVVEVNQYGVQSINTRIMNLLDTCMAENPLETCRLLSRYSEISESIRKHCGWTPLGPIVVAPQFNYCKEFSKYMNLEESECSVFYIGRACANALLRVNYSGPSQPFFDSDRPVEFQIKTKITLPGKIWSVGCDRSGDFALFGDDEGQLYRLDFNNLSLTSLGSGLHSANNYLPGKEKILAHPTKRGVFAVCGGGILSVVDFNSSRNFFTEYDMKGNSYGDVCWHPTDADLLFYCNTAQEKLFLVRASKIEIVRTYKIEEPITSITYCGDAKLGLLTAKVVGSNHQIVLLDYETGVKTNFEIPTHTPTAQYTTLVCSQWDYRTLMLLGSPNIILLIDKIGKRPTRIIYGPCQKNYMLRATFFGLMDKYILAISEEPDGVPKAFVYNRFTGHQVGYLSGHSDQINDVSVLNDKEGPLLVTAGDDNTVHFYKFFGPVS